MSCVIRAFGCVYCLHLQGGQSQYKYSLHETLGARDSAVFWGTALQARRSRVRFPTVSLDFDMYMSYRWRESFNTVRSPSDSWRHHNGEWHVWAQNAERRGGGMDHPSRRWLIICARTAVLYVCLSIALTSCTTSMAETNLDAIRK